MPQALEVKVGDVVYACSTVSTTYFLGIVLNAAPEVQAHIKQRFPGSVFLQVLDISRLPNLALGASASFKGGEVCEKLVRTYTVLNPETDNRAEPRRTAKILKDQGYKGQEDGTYVKLPASRRPHRRIVPVPAEVKTL